MLTANAFDLIKETLNIAEVAANYGVEVKRNNQALCPFHNEKTPSFTIFPKTNSFKCFGCGVGGSVIDFAMLMSGTDALEAAKMLDSDYSLGLFNCEASQEERHKLKEQQARQNADKGLDKAFRGFMDKAFDILCAYLHLLHEWKITHAPKTAHELSTASPLFVEACHYLDYIEYLTDSLLNASIDEEISFYKTHRKELKNIAAKLQQNSGKADNTA